MPWPDYGPRPTLVIPAGDSAKAILGLPIAALRLPKTMVEDLSVLGFARIGELAAKPRAPLALRFGPELCRRLDQAMGSLSEPIDPVRPPDLIEVRRVFAEPIGAAETIARYTGKLTGQLCEALEAKGLGARQLDLLFHRVDNRIEAVRIGTARPVRDVKRLTRLLCDKIETIDPGFGIEIMRLAVPLAEPLAPKQMISCAHRRTRGGCLRPHRYARQSSRGTTALSLWSGRERRAGTLDSEDRANRAKDRRDLARSLAVPLAASRASVAETGADRDARLAARPSARQFHLARHKAPRDMRRRPRAGFWGMVEAGRRTLHGPRLFSGRGRGGRAFLDLSLWRWRGHHHWLAALVPARNFRMSAARYAELQCTSHFSFLRGASSCEELFAEAAQLGIEALAITDRNSLAGIVRAHEAGQGDRRAA